MSECRYTFNTPNGEVTITGKANMMAYLAVNGEESIGASVSKSPTRPSFYSQLQRAIEGVPARMDNMPASQWKQWIASNAPKLQVKAEEIEWSGINDYLDLRGKDRVSRDDLVTYLADNGVRVEETVLGTNGLHGTGEMYVAEANDWGDEWAVFAEDGSIIGGTYESEAAAEQAMVQINSDGKPTKYGDYTLPGGENYREVLLTLPERKNAPVEGGKSAERTMFERDMMEKYGADSFPSVYGRMNGDEIDKYERLVREDRNNAKRESMAQDRRNNYKSSHWDQPNVLAHTRLDDRTDADGKRVLFVNELQSDWGQDGKRRGFLLRNPEEARRGVQEKMERAKLLREQAGRIERQIRAKVRAFRDANPDAEQISDDLLAERSANADRIRDLMRQADAATEEARALNAEISTTSGKVPAAPFVTKTEGWLDLVLKRIAMLAVEGGYDKVAFINGQQAADLYDLSKTIESIGYDPKTGRLEAFDKSRSRVLDQRDIKPDQLDDYIGKEAAKRLLATEPIMGKHLLEGEEIKTGGEGMRAFYDQIVPQRISKLLPKLGGGRLGSVVFGGEDVRGRYAVFDEDSGERLFRTDIRSEANEYVRSYPGDAIIKEVDGDAGVGLVGGQPGFDVTDKMRESVEAGVPLFSRQRLIDQIKAKSLPGGFIVNDLLKSPSQTSVWDRTVGTMYNLAQKNEGFRRVFNAVQRFITDVSAYANAAADLAPNILPKLDSIADLKKQPISAEDVKALSGPVFGGTLKYTRGQGGQVEPTDDVQTAGLVWTDDELRSRYGLNDGQIRLYREFRAATDRSLNDLTVSDMLRYVGSDADAVRDQVLATSDATTAAGILESHLRDVIREFPERERELANTIDKVLEKADQANSLIGRGYAPLSRFGNYTVYVTGQDGEQIYFGMFESAREANKMERAMRALYPDANVSTGTMSKEDHKLFQGVNPETMALFGEAISGEESGDAEQKAIFQQYLKLAVGNRSAMKRLIERKGITGYSEDFARVLAGFVYSNSRKISQNLHTAEITQAQAAVKEGEVKDMAIKMVEYVQNPQEEAAALKGFLFTQYIGGSLASAAVNLTQPWTMTLPYLSQFAGIASATKRMVQATRMAGSGKIDNQELAQALARAKSEGLVSPQEVFSLMRQAQGKAALQSGDGTKAGDAAAKANNLFTRLAFLWGRPFSLAEQFNREVAFIAAYQLAQDKDLGDPYAFAEKAIAETAGIYNKGNRPVLARGLVGSFAFTFKQYSISYCEMLKRMYDSGPEGKKAAAFALGILILSAGMSGLPGAEDAMDLADFFGQRVMGKNFSSRAWADEFLHPLLLNGISGAAGVPIDISGRMGLGNFIPGTGLLQKKTDYTSDVVEIAGPGADFLKRVAKAVGKAAEGDVQGSAEAVSPLAIQNVAKALDMASTGMYRDQKGRKVIDVDGFDALMKGIGFQPNAVARTQEGIRNVQQQIALNKLTETEIADLWANGRIERNQAKIDEAKARLARWNEANPGSPIRIDPEQINKRVQEANKTKAQRMSASAPKEIRGQVKSELDRMATVGTR